MPAWGWWLLGALVFALLVLPALVIAARGRGWRALLPLVAP